MMLQKVVRSSSFHTEKLNAPKYWDSLNENPVQSIQNLRLGRRFTFQQDNDPKHTARVDYNVALAPLNFCSAPLKILRYICLHNICVCIVSIYYV